MKLFAALAALFFCASSWAAGDRQANALLVIPSPQAAFDEKFQDFLDKNGARLLHSYPPGVFVGYIPQALDAALGEKYGALVYRGKVEDRGSFARYGENAVFAVNAWNRRFVEEPPEAPLAVSARTRQAGGKEEGLDLFWSEVMTASSYRLQISTDRAFGSVSLDTALARNNYRIIPVFWKDGVYYWRVAGILALDSGGTRAGAFSAPYSFAVSRPARAPGPKPAAPVLPARVRFKGRPLSWPEAAAFKYYRLQLSETADFSAPLVDVFTDTCAFKLSGFPVRRGTPYYMRVMGSDGASAGDWSGVSEVVIETPGPIANDVRRRLKK